MDKFVALIPAKKHSLRLENKNMRDLCGKPLFAHSVEQARAIGLHCVVSTDSKEIIDYCTRNNVSSIEEKVEEERMENCCLNVFNHFPCEYLVLLQPTHPLRTVNTIEKGIKLIEGQNSLITVTPMRPLFFKDGKSLFDVQNRKITQKTSKTDFYLYFDGVLTITSSTFLKEKDILFDENALLLESEPIERYDIHTELDFYVVESIMQKYGNPNL